jgi:two-component system nitrogen regulation response regulator GlnG
LFWYFLATSAAELGQLQALPCEESGAREIGAWAELFHRFLSFPWPGNVRELSNFAQQIVLASERALVIPPAVIEALERESGDVPVKASGGRETGGRNMREVDDSEIDRALADNGFVVAAAARQLKVSRPSLYRRMENSPRHRLATQLPLDEIRQVLGRTGGDAAAAARQLRVSASGLRARLRNTELEWH